MKFIYRLILLLSFFASAVIAVFSLLMHVERDFIDFSEDISVKTTNPFWAFMVAAITIAADILLIKILFVHSSSPYRRMLILFAIFMAVEGIMGAIWISNYSIMPVADQDRVWDMAEKFAEHAGETGDLSYFQLYPQQKSISAIMSVFSRLFHENGMLAYRSFCVICSVICILFGGLLAYYMSGKEQAGGLAALLLVEFIPLFLYSAFIYGTIPSLCFILIAFYAVCRLIKTNRVRYLLLEIICCVLMYAFYTASLIAMIAISVTIFVAAAKSWKAQTGRIRSILIGGIVLPILLAFAFSKGCSYYFMIKTGLSSNTEHIPPSAWVVMGLKSEPAIGAGGYDASNVKLFHENENNTEKTDSAAKKEIHQLVSEYVSHKRNSQFFLDKTISQWTDPTFGGITMTVYHNETDRLGSLSSMFVPQILQRTENFLLAIMYTCYLMASFYFIAQFREKNIPPERILLPVYYMGGFAFQLFWESKSRYCLPYYICLLILAGIGMSDLDGWISEIFRSVRFQRRRHNQNQCG